MNYEIVHDCDDDDGTPTCYSAEDAYGRYWWIDVDSTGFTCTTKLEGALSARQTCKTLTSAKRWITENCKKYKDRG